MGPAHGMALMRFTACGPLDNGLVDPFSIHTYIHTYIHIYIFIYICNLQILQVTFCNFFKNNLKNKIVSQTSFFF